MKDEARADKREKWKKPGLALDLLAGNTRQALAEFRDLRREVVSLATETGILRADVRVLRSELADLGAQLDAPCRTLNPAEGAPAGAG
jgi:hypothetical protein